MAVAAGPATEQLTELYRSQRLSLLRLAVLLTGDRAQAEDVVHDAFAALARRWPSLAEPDRAAGYLRVSVVNGARSLHRKRAVISRHLRSAAPQPAPAADSSLLAEEQTRAMVAAVRRLPRRQQQVIALRYWAELSDGQIATELRISSVTVRATASKALKTLRQWECR